MNLPLYRHVNKKCDIRSVAGRSSIVEVEERSSVILIKIIGRNERILFDINDRR